MPTDPPTPRTVTNATEHEDLRPDPDYVCGASACDDPACRAHGPLLADEHRADRIEGPDAHRAAQDRDHFVRNLCPARSPSDTLCTLARGHDEADDWDGYHFATSPRQAERWLGRARWQAVTIPADADGRATLDEAFAALRRWQSRTGIALAAFGDRGPILAEVLAEARRGADLHPHAGRPLGSTALADYFGVRPEDLLHVVAARAAHACAEAGIVTPDRARRRVEVEKDAGSVTWLDVLIEEVSEAAEASVDPDGLAAMRAELIQVAAVAVNMVAAIDAAGTESTGTAW